MSASVTAVTTPVRLLAATLVATVAATGCSTFTDDETVARVDGTELSESELRSAIRQFNADDELVQADTGEVRQTIVRWVLAQVLRDDLVGRGLDVAPIPSGDELTVDGLFAQTDPLITEWRAAGPPSLDSDGLETLYARGPVDGGIVCAAHILTDDAATAELVIERLDDGADFAELAAEYSVDPGSADAGGVLPCATTAAFETQYIPEFVAAALAAEPGEVVGPVASQFGFHVIRLRPFDQIDTAEVEQIVASDQVRFALLVEDADIWVNPRFGQFDPVVGIAPVG